DGRAATHGHAAGAQLRLSLELTYSPRDGDQVTEVHQVTPAAAEHEDRFRRRRIAVVLEPLQVEAAQLWVASLVVADHHAAHREHARDRRRGTAALHRVDGCRAAGAGRLRSGGGGTR